MESNHSTTLTVGEQVYLLGYVFLKVDIFSHVYESNSISFYYYLLIIKGCFIANCRFVGNRVRTVL